MFTVFIIIIVIIILLLLLFFFCRNLFLRIAGKIANIRTRKNVVPHGSLIMLLPDLTVKRNRI